MQIAVVALGKIGLPLAVQFAEKGHSVVGCDVNASTVDLVNKGIVNFTMTSKEFGSVVIHNVFGAASNTSGRMWISDCGAGAWVSHYTMIL